ncbi:hypothetical protein Ancab_031583 [Ancistrocladus abbreviatus]
MAPTAASDTALVDATTSNSGLFTTSNFVRDHLDRFSSITTTTTFADIHSDIVQTNILPRLDGSSLAAVSCASAQLQRLCSLQDLWSHICNTTWPSTDTPLLHHIISSFPNGPHSFFSLSFPLLHPSSSTNSSSATGAANPHPASPSLLQQLISAVDVSYRGEVMLSKIQETETGTGGLRCFPFRIDLLEPKGVVPTPVRKRPGGDTCQDLYDNLSLSWIIIDPIGRRAMNMSSIRPVSVQRRWLCGEVQVRFAAFLSREAETEPSCQDVMCVIDITCGGGGEEGGEEGDQEVDVREVSLRMEDMDGVHLTGKESLVILERAFEGKRVNRGKSAEERVRSKYEEFMEIRRERRERKSRREWRLDMLCACSGVSIFLSLFVYLFMRT